MKNILTLDVGNSNYQCIIYNEKMEILYNQRVSSIREANLVKDYYQNIQKNFKENIDLFVISCVIPYMTDCLIKTAQTVFNCPVIPCDLEHVPLSVALDNPKELGMDFIASALGAKHKYNLPTLIIDMGTANKISLIDHNPFELIGGIISPGIGQQFGAYKEILSHLPATTIEVPEKVIGKNTIQCIQSGITYGTFLGLIALSQEMEKEYQQKCQTILTGGYSTLFKDHKGLIFDPTLVNDGLFYLGLSNL